MLKKHLTVWSGSKKYGYGDNFINWIRLLYASPQASVHTNDNRSTYFWLGRGTRQGCPLSPLLFALAIEPLSIALRSSLLLQGVVRSGILIKLSLYADDLLLYVSNPIPNFPVILSMLQKFGSFSGYKINLHKSECFPINALAMGLLQSDVPFKLSRTGFRYLGINITHSMSSLVSGNFTPLLEQTHSDFLQWSNLPLSLIGRINAVKMNVLPKFLFALQCIPLFLPKQFFKSIDQIVTDFLWAGKVPRIRKSLLQKCQLNGGLSLPNFMFYYWSVNIHKITFWLSSSTTTYSANSCISTSPLALLTSPI
ncbi:hypothetical protein PO909_026766 [Leuciscus waleckii]